MKKLLMIFAMALIGAALSGCVFPGGKRGGNALIETPGLPGGAPDARVAMLNINPDGFRSISHADVSFGSPKKGADFRTSEGDAVVQQSTNAGGGATNDNIVVDTEFSTLEVRHSGGDSGDWTVEVNNAGGTGNADFSSVALAGGTAYAFAEVSIIVGDWLAYGVWAYVPDDQAAHGDFELGAFVAGRDSFLVQHEITSGDQATYSGDAAGFILGAASSLSFTGEVALTANFGGGVADSDMNGGISTDIGLRLELNQNVINNGFVTGALSSDNSTNPAYRNFVGNWGANLAGGNSAAPTQIPSHAIGTFGGKDNSSGTGGDVLIGTFIAERDTP